MQAKLQAEATTTLGAFVMAIDCEEIHNAQILVQIQFNFQLKYTHRK